MNKHSMSPDFLIDMATSGAPAPLAWDYRMAIAALTLALASGRGRSILTALRAVLTAERALLAWFADPLNQLVIDAIDHELAALDAENDDICQPN